MRATSHWPFCACSEIPSLFKPREVARRQEKRKHLSFALWKLPVCLGRRGVSPARGLLCQQAFLSIDKVPAP